MHHIDVPLAALQRLCAVSGDSKPSRHQLYRLHLYERQHSYFLPYAFKYRQRQEKDLNEVLQKEETEEKCPSKNWNQISLSK